MKSSRFLTKTAKTLMAGSFAIAVGLALGVGQASAATLTGDDVAFYTAEQNSGPRGRPVITGFFPFSANAITVQDNVASSTAPDAAPTRNFSSLLTADVNGSSITLFSNGGTGSVYDTAPSFLILSGLDFDDGSNIVDVVISDATYVGSGPGMNFRSFEDLTSTDVSFGTDIIGTEVIAGEPFGIGIPGIANPANPATDPQLLGQYVIFNLTALDPGQSGSSITFDFITDSGGVGPGNEVPLPASAWLLVAGLGTMVSARRRSKSKA